LLLGYGFTHASNNQSETAQIIIGLRHFFGFNLERWKKSAREEEHQMAKHEKKKLSYFERRDQLPLANS